MAIETSDLIHASGLLIFQDPPFFESGIGFDGPPERVGVGQVRVRLTQAVPADQAGFCGNGGGGPGVPVIVNISPDLTPDVAKVGVRSFIIELYKLDGTLIDTGCSLTILRLPKT